MCGIVGFTTPGQDPAAAKQIVQGMADLIRHRGPDGEGCYADGTAALGHRRLSVIDLAGGGQPMLNEDGTLVVVFNGEIYNYKTLRARLQQRGHTFATDSDTEVLLHGYEEWGRDLPCRLRGMFAFAVWDRKRGTLFCARDLFGIKPRLPPHLLSSSSPPRQHPPRLRRSPVRRAPTQQRRRYRLRLL